MPSELEIKNANKILEMLLKTEDVSFEQHPEREDIFIVKEPETGLELIIDVEETTICFLMDICPVPVVDEQKLALYEKLLEINNVSVHGAFSVNNGKVIFKDNLEIENIDQNELDASIQLMLVTVAQNIEAISHCCCRSLIC